MNRRIGKTYQPSGNEPDIFIPERSVIRSKRQRRNERMGMTENCHTIGIGGKCNWLIVYHTADFLNQDAK